MLMVETRGMKRKRDDQGDGSRPAPEAPQPPVQRNLKRAPAEATEWRRDLAASQDKVANLTKRVEELEQQLRTLQEGRERAMPTPEVQVRSAAQDGPPSEVLPKKRDYYAEHVRMKNGPDRNKSDDVKEFYRRGGIERNRLMLAKPGSDLKRFEHYDPEYKIPRDATPPAESRSRGIAIQDWPGRQYFDVNFNDRETAVKDYGLVEEGKSNSRWEHVVMGSVNKATVRHYSEDDAVKLRAMERWSIIDVTTGKRTPPPARYDPRAHGERGR